VDDRKRHLEAGNKEGIMKQRVTQGRILVEAMKRKPLTYGDMLQVLQWQSCSPWKRASEALKADEQIVKGKRWMGGRSYLTTWKVVSIPLADRA
jgi:hypothetical protein